eukprot:TRINITY_DN1800_c0_g1_i1.p1 TRINITY_DN1800_c0_g1~~TRINITY_DN1800_c0_g1_i1.p1  ORF type:complete len:445 (+),score=64.51 TRINITY_DN1800_c0_g1_i1:193-1335(+)
MIVTTGSQGEERAALQLASIDQSTKLRLHEKDLILYSAKVIPGNDVKVMQMMNRISQKGPKIAMGRGELLHSSGHAYRDELTEVLQLVKPQHFLPVHGEYAFLTAHAELAQELGVNHVKVIRNGEMLGVDYLRNGKQYSNLSGMHKLGEATLQFLYNDGNRGTGNRKEMRIEERQKLASEGLVVVALDIIRKPSSTIKNLVKSGKKGVSTPRPQDIFGQGLLSCKVKLTTRGMWEDEGKLLEILYNTITSTVESMSGNSSPAFIEERVTKDILTSCFRFNQKSPEVLVIAHEFDPRAASILAKIDQQTKAKEKKKVKKQKSETADEQKTEKTGQNGHKELEELPDDLKVVDKKILDARKMANPRDQLVQEADDEYDMTYG